MMTRKDYVQTAQILSSYKDSIGDELTFQDLVDDFSAMFHEDNPRFNPETFRKACEE
jgi:hypothetical protein